MKTKIHPQYKKTQIVCNACKTVYEVGSTGENLTVEICSNCHPYYTGKSEQLVDTFDVIKNFNERAAAADTSKVIKKRKKLAERKSSTTDAVGQNKPLTLKDMMKQLQK